jgi:hypothetical protein
LTGFFVSGALALLTSYTNPSLGLANGTTVIMHSLSLDGRDDYTRINRLLKQSGQTPAQHKQHVPAARCIPSRTASWPFTPSTPANRTNNVSHKFERLALGQPAFSLTVHKIHGQTCDKLISTYVLRSRAQSSSIPFSVHRRDQRKHPALVELRHHSMP